MMRAPVPPIDNITLLPNSTRGPGNWLLVISAGGKLYRNRFDRNFASLLTAFRNAIVGMTGVGQTQEVDNAKPIILIREIAVTPMALAVADAKAWKIEITDEAKRRTFAGYVNGDMGSMFACLRDATIYFAAANDIITDAEANRMATRAVT